MGGELFDMKHRKGVLLEFKTTEKLQGGLRIEKNKKITSLQAIRQ